MNVEKSKKRPKKIMNPFLSKFARLIMLEAFRSKSKLGDPPTYATKKPEYRVRKRIGAVVHAQPRGKVPKIAG